MNFQQLDFSEILNYESSKILKQNYDFNQTKIFGIGLSRTATTSLQKAVSMLGFRCAHWINPRNRKILSLPDFLFFDGVFDTCVAFNFEYLFYLFPQSKFILTTREMNDWLRSVKQLFKLNSPQQFRSYYRSPNNTNSFYHYIIHQTLYGQYQSWEEAYKAYNHRVKSFFKDNSHRLLELDICKGDGWEKLCPFLNKSIPSQPFPHENRFI